jgi:hypothetical protein
VGAWCALSAACASSNPPIDRHLIAHAIRGCSVTGTPTLLVTALGDFGSSRASATVDANGVAALDLPTNLVGVEAQLLPQGAWGVGYADPPTDVSFALWSSEDACDATDLAVSPSVGGQALTTFDGGNRLFVAGLMPSSGDRNLAAYALALDLTTGETAADVAAAGLPRPRAFASATSFGSGVLVAGGVDPNDPKDPADDVVADTAFVFSGGRFEANAVELGDARAHHGAVVLASGETLLVGGVGRDGAVLASVEAIDPITRNPRFFQLATLMRARRDPVVFRLANGEIVVAGGTDDRGAPIGTVEWLASDGAPCRRTACSTEIPPAVDRAFVALPSGAILAAGGVDTAQPAADVYWIRPDGVVDPLPPLSPDQRGVGKIRLIGASDGAPWLFNGRTWWRFDPWQTAFVAPDAAPSDGPDDDMPAPLAIDAGLFVWLARQTANDATSGARVRGFRHGVRGPYTRDVDLMLFSDASHWIADRPPAADVEFDRDGLHLDHGARAVLADTIYGDCRLDAATPSQILPTVEIGAAAVGDPSCTWPAPQGNQISITRRGTSLDVGVDGVHRVCDGPPGHVAIGLRAPDSGRALVTKLTITRL